MRPSLGTGGSLYGAREMMIYVRNDMIFWLKNGGFHAENDGFHAKDDGFHAENDGFRTKNKIRYGTSSRPRNHLVKTKGIMTR